MPEIKEIKIENKLYDAYIGITRKKFTTDIDLTLYLDLGQFDFSMGVTLSLSQAKTLITILTETCNGREE